jgi:hypothetical protein
MRTTHKIAAAALLLFRPQGNSTPVNTVAPSVSGTTNVGETLTGTPGTWSGSPVLTYQWRRDGVDIGGETGLTYLLADADFGTMIDWLEIPNGDTGAAVASAAVGPVAGLLGRLISYWSLEEASGTRNDAHGTNHLTDNNTVTNAAGKVGNAAAFASASSEYLSIADNATLSRGDTAFTIALWARFATRTNGGIFSKWASAGQREYTIFDNNTDHVPNNRMCFQISADGTASTRVDATSFGNLATGTWYFVVVRHDPVANTISIQVNDSAVDSASHSGGAFNGTSALDIGRLLPATYPLNGNIDEIGLWGRILTLAESTWLYNSGSGRAYADLPSF